MIRRIYKIEKNLAIYGALVILTIIAINFRIFARISFIAFVVHMCRKYGVLHQIKNVHMNRRKGKEGELSVSKVLKSLEMDKVIFNDINLEYDECKSQIDHILITKNGIFNIETKNYSGIISIDSNGNWIQTIRNKDRHIDNATDQSLLHENTLKRITKGKYKIHNLIVIANEFTEIVTQHNSKVPVIRIDDFKEYIESFEMPEVKYNVDQIAENINNYKIAFIKKALKVIHYFIKDNKVAIALLVVVLLIDRSIVNQFPKNLLDSGNNVLKEQTDSDSVFNINESINLKEINSTINITNITKTKDEVLVDMIVENNNSKKELSLLDFAFSFVSYNNIVYDDILLPYRSSKININPKEKMELTARFECYDNISEGNNFVVKYDNSNIKLEKRLVVLLKNNIINTDAKSLSKEANQ